MSDVQLAPKAKNSKSTSKKDNSALKSKDKKDKKVDTKDKEKDKKKSSSKVSSSSSPSTSTASNHSASSDANKKVTYTDKTSSSTNGSTSASNASYSSPSVPMEPPAGVVTPSGVNIKLDICAGCNKNIMGDVSHAMNKKWHIYCFVCSVCQIPVSDEYYESDGKPYCRRDFNKLFGVTCAGCKKALAGKKTKSSGEGMAYSMLRLL